MPTKSMFENMLNKKSVSKKVMSEEDMPQDKNEPMEEGAMETKMHLRGVRSPKAGKSKSTYANMLKGGK